MHDQSCLILCEPMDCSLPGYSVHGILQARILEWVAISSSKGSSWPRDWTRVSCTSCTGRQVLYHWATREAQVSIFDYFKISVQFSRSVMSNSLRPHLNRSTPGLPVHLHLPEFTQTHVHQVSDAIQPSHPPLSPSPPAPNRSQHQSLFQWVNSSHEVAKVLEFQLQHHSLQRNLRADLLQNGLVGSPCSPRDSQESSPTPQFKSINSSALSFLHSPTLTSILAYILTIYYSQNKQRL